MIKYLIFRIDLNRYIEVLLLPHKGTTEYSFVNLFKRHICSCRLSTVEEAEKDLYEQ